MHFICAADRRRGARVRDHDADRRRHRPGRGHARRRPCTPGEPRARADARRARRRCRSTCCCSARATPSRAEALRRAGAWPAPAASSCTRTGARRRPRSTPACASPTRRACRSRSTPTRSTRPGFLESTVEAIAGRTIHAYHTEGAGGGHAPDIIRDRRAPERAAVVDQPDAAAHGQHGRRAPRHADGLPPPQPARARGPRLRREPDPRDDDRGRGRAARPRRDLDDRLRLAGDGPRRRDDHPHLADRARDEGAAAARLEGARRRQRPRRGATSPSTRSARRSRTGIDGEVGSVEVGQARRPRALGSALLRRPAATSCSRAARSPGRRSATPNASIPTPQPVLGAADVRGLAVARPAEASLAFVAPAALDDGLAERLGLRRAAGRRRPTRAGSARRDMPENDGAARDPRRRRRRSASGSTASEIEPRPAAELPLAQRYFLFLMRCRLAAPAHRRPLPGRRLRALGRARGGGRGRARASTACRRFLRGRLRGVAARRERARRRRGARRARGRSRRAARARRRGPRALPEPAAARRVVAGSARSCCARPRSSGPASAARRATATRARRRRGRSRSASSPAAPASTTASSPRPTSTRTPPPSRPRPCGCSPSTPPSPARWLRRGRAARIDRLAERRGRRDASRAHRCRRLRAARSSSLARPRRPRGEALCHLSARCGSGSAARSAPARARSSPRSAARSATSCAIGVVTNDIYTTEDALFLRRTGVLPPERILAVETGGCPHTAIRDDVSANLEAVAELERARARSTSSSSRAAATT